MRYQRLWRTAALLTSAILTLGVAAVYEGVRGMSETIGLSWNVVSAPALVLLIAFLPWVGTACFLRAATGARGDNIVRKLLRWILATATASLLLCATAEAAFQYDEHQFMAEAQRALAEHPTQDIYSRDRAWPNAGTSLVWIRGLGPHATD